jgi:hypothetical protein
MSQALREAFDRRLGCVVRCVTPTFHQSAIELIFRNTFHSCLRGIRDALLRSGVDDNRLVLLVDHKLAYIQTSVMFLEELERTLPERTCAARSTRYM